VFIVVWLPLRVAPVTPGAHLSVLAAIVRIDAPVFPTVGKGRQLHRVFQGYIWVRSRCHPQVCSTPLKSLCQGTWCFRLPLTPPSSYVGELPNSHGRTLTGKSYVLHGIPYLFSPAIVVNLGNYRKKCSQGGQDHLWPCLPKALCNLQESFDRQGIGDFTFSICFGEYFPLSNWESLAINTFTPLDSLESACPVSDFACPCKMG
jgi:hypothetical protein